MKILLDTSFLLSAMEKKLDIVSALRIFGEPELYTLNLVIEELKGFSKGASKKARNSRLSLNFIEKAGVKVIRATGKNTDSNIVGYAGNRRMKVCTIDGNLKKTLRRRGTGVITIRQGRYLVKDFGR
jgi:rRNA-processing protein FCF1